MKEQWVSAGSKKYHIAEVYSRLRELDDHPQYAEYATNFTILYLGYFAQKCKGFNVKEKKPLAFSKSSSFKATQPGYTLNIEYIHKTHNEFFNVMAYYIGAKV